MEFTVRQYQPGDEAAIAQMWNESDTGWPGSWTGGIPITEEWIRDWLHSDRPWVLWLAVTPEGRIIGYNQMSERREGEQKVAYVDLLNVVPACHKMGVGKALLFKAVETALEAKLPLLGLGTWAGNLKAVPVYKKTGFHWVPRTYVEMINFVPSVVPLAPDFFTGDTWYTARQLEFRQAPDDYEDDGQGIYPYLWQKDGRMIRAIFDRRTKKLTAWEDDQVAFSCHVVGGKLVAGRPGKVRWVIVNKGPMPITVSLQGRGEDGVAVSQESALTVSDRAVIEAEVKGTLDKAAGNEEGNDARILTQWVIGNRFFHTETSAPVRAPLALSLEPRWPALTPGRPRPAQLVVRSFWPEEVNARLSLVTTPGLAAQMEDTTLTVPVNGFAATNVMLDAASAGAHTLIVQAEQTKDEGRRTEEGKADVKTDTTDHAIRHTMPEPVKSPRAEFKLTAVGANDVVGVAGDGEVSLEAGRFRLTVASRAGEVTLTDRETGESWLHQSSGLGPSFHPSAFRYARLLVSLEPGPAIQIVAPLETMPGWRFEKRLTLSPQGVIQVNHKLTNTGSEARSIELLVGHRQSFGCVDVVIPAVEGVVIEETSHFPDWYGPEDETPAGLSEGWTALTRPDGIIGFVWERDRRELKKVIFGHWSGKPLFLYAPGEVPPGETIELPTFYIYAGPGDWRTVRALWRQLLAPTAPADPPAPRPAIQVKTGDAPVVTVLDGAATVQMQVDSLFRRQVKGKVTVSLPAGWQVTPATFAFTGLGRNHPISQSLNLSYPGQPAAVEGMLTIQTETCEVCRPLPLIVLGRRQPLTITEGIEERLRVVRIDNGYLQLKVAPDFAASLVSLEHNGSNHLLTAFPQARPFIWMNPWFGGVRPLLLAADEPGYDEGHPGYLHNETVQVQPLLPTADNPWGGVRLWSDLKQTPNMAGITLETDYLTVGDSNLVKVIGRVINRTAATRACFHSLEVYVAPGGDPGKTRLHADRAISRRNRQQMWWGIAGDIVVAENEENGVSLALVKGNREATITLFDMALDGVNPSVLCKFSLAPGASREFVNYLVLTESAAAAKAYRVLAG